MKPFNPSRRRAFTLLETVIAIGVLSVLLTGFMVVFVPAAEGIRKSINVQQADRLASTVEQELVTLRDNRFTTGFNKAYASIGKSNVNPIMVYQYRGKIGGILRADGTPEPLVSLKDSGGKFYISGKDFKLVPMARRLSTSDTASTPLDDLFKADLLASEGAVYLVKCTQLVFKTGALELGDKSFITDPKNPGAAIADPDLYPEAVIAFSADFFMMPAKTEAYFGSTAFTSKFPTLKSPVFSRNLAVRR